MGISRERTRDTALDRLICADTCVRKSLSRLKALPNTRCLLRVRFCVVTRTQALSHASPCRSFPDRDPVTVLHSLHFSSLRCCGLVCRVSRFLVCLSVARRTADSDLSRLFRRSSWRFALWQFQAHCAPEASGSFLMRITDASRPAISGSPDPCPDLEMPPLGLPGQARHGYPVVR